MVGESIFAAFCHQFVRRERLLYLTRTQSSPPMRKKLLRCAQRRFLELDSDKNRPTLARDWRHLNRGIFPFNDCALTCSEPPHHRALGFLDRVPHECPVFRRRLRRDLPLKPRHVTRALRVVCNFLNRDALDRTHLLATPATRAI